MREAYRCGDFDRRISCCFEGVFWRCDSAVIANRLLPVNFWRRLRVAWVVVRLSGDIAAALTLTSNLLRTRPCTSLPDKPSLRLSDDS